MISSARPPRNHVTAQQGRRQPCGPGHPRSCRTSGGHAASGGVRCSSGGRSRWAWAVCGAGGIEWWHRHDDVPSLASPTSPIVHETPAGPARSACRDSTSRCLPRPISGCSVAATRRPRASRGGAAGQRQPASTMRDGRCVAYSATRSRRARRAQRAQTTADASRHKTARPDACRSLMGPRRLVRPKAGKSALFARGSPARPSCNATSHRMRRRRNEDACIARAR